MTEKQMEVYRKVHEAHQEEQRRMKEEMKQKAIQHREEGKSHPCDYVYFREEEKNKIAHQDEKIAHPDTMRKTPATILLVIGMVGSLIFKQWYLVWVILFGWYFSKDRV
jgi:hypothetical protein